MKKEVFIYDNDRQTTGVRVSEYFKKSYKNEDCESVTIEIPDEMEPYENAMMGTMVKCGEFVYSLDECIGIDKNDQIFIKSMEPGQLPRYLKIVSRNGRKSRAITI